MTLLPTVLPSHTKLNHARLTRVSPTTHALCLNMELEAYCALCGVPFDVFADLYRKSEITGNDVAWTKYFIACELARVFPPGQR